MDGEDMSDRGFTVTLDPVELFSPKDNDELVNDILSGRKPAYELIHELDQEIRVKKRRLVGACTIRNSLLPIFSLPDEVLSHIIFLSSVDPGGDESRFDDVYSLRWMKLVTVCRRFREAILTTHALWTYISVPLRKFSKSYRIERVAHHLGRSGSLPLSVRFYLDKEYISHYILQVYGSPENEGLYLLNPSRLRELHVEAPVSLIKTWSTEYTAASYPLLEKLVLKVDTYKLENPTDTLPLTVPDAFFAGDSPRIRALKLENVSIDLGTVHDLIELSLLYDSDRPEAHGPMYTFPAIVSLLSRSPDLTSLTLFLPWSTSGAYVHLGRIALPQLNSLHLRGDIWDCAELLRAIQCPPTVTMYLLPQGLSNGNAARSLMLRLREIYRGYIHGTPGADIGTLALEGSRTHMTMCAHFKSGVFPPRPIQQYPIQLNSHPHREVYRRQILTRLIDALPTHNLTHLDLKMWGSRVVTAATWKTIILRLPSLQHILVSPAQRSFVSLPAALLLLYEKGNHVPSLQQICLAGAYYSAMRDYGDMGEDYERAITNGKRGLKLLKVYMKMRKPTLPVLELDACDSIAEGPACYHRLQRYIGKLIVDGSVYGMAAETSKGSR